MTLYIKYQSMLRVDNIENVSLYLIILSNFLIELKTIKICKCSKLKQKKIFFVLTQ